MSSSPNPTKVKREYLVVSHYVSGIHKEADFTVRVQAMLDEGWELAGGLSVNLRGSGMQYSQALTRTRSILTQRPVIDEEL